MRATYGLILIYHSAAVRRSAAYRWDGGAISLNSEAFAADDVVHLPPGHFQPPLDEAALLVPLYSEKEQLGALVLGRPVNGIRYSSEDVTNLLNLTDRIGEYIASSHRKTEQMAQIVRLAEPAAALHADHPLSAEVVEDALRNLYDYNYLGDTPLAAMRLTAAHLSQGQVTSLERGKAAHAVILESIEKLRPGTDTPRDPPPRVVSVPDLAGRLYRRGFEPRDHDAPVYLGRDIQPHTAQRRALAGEGYRGNGSRARLSTHSFSTWKPAFVWRVFCFPC